MATATLVSIDDYLQNTSYHPDVEYLDGELKERPVVVRAHGFLQVLIGTWFMMHEDEWKIRAGVEIRTRVSPTRVRLPDVAVEQVEPESMTDQVPPLIVIEILSPGDSYAETQRLAKDYQEMGVANIWLIDPETETGRTCEGAAWIEVKRFQVAGSPIYLDLDEQFKRLNRYGRL